MPATVILAAVGAGKTEAALQRLTHTLQDSGTRLAKAWVLLATRRQEIAFRQRLSDLIPARSVYFNVESFNFYELYARLLNLAGQPQRRLHDSARPGLLRHVLADLAEDGGLTVFRQVAQTPGFVHMLLALIDELKQNQVAPEALEQAASTPKDADIARIYARYQALLQHYRLVDREGEGWLALEAVQALPHLARDVALLVVDGYDQFTPVQAQLLAHLGQQAGETLITLTTVPGREQTIGRRFQQTLERLHAAHERSGCPLAVHLFDQAEAARHPALQYLSTHVFQRGQPPPPPAAPPIFLLEAPDAATETAAILRQVKRLLLEGERPDDILIALRDRQRYQTHFETCARLYDLPVLLHHPESISTSPVMIALLKLLELATAACLHPATAFRRRDVLELLSSPYLRVPGLDAAQVHRLERLSLAGQVIAGKAAWLKAIDRAAATYDDDEGQTITPLLTDAEAAELSLALESFFNSLTPPPRATTAAYITWLDALIGADTQPDEADDPEQQAHSTASTLDVPGGIRAAGDNGYLISRDMAALNALKDILRGITQTQELLRAVSQRLITAEVTWEQFYADVLSGIQYHRPAPRTPVRSGRVLVTTAADARGLPHRHVFIPGLSEGIFPAPAPEDPLYLDSERRRLQEAGIWLETQAQRAADDGLFYELLCLPSHTLTLSRPTVRDGKPWLPSHLWRMTATTFPPGTLPLRRLKANDTPGLHEAATPDEALLALAQALAGAGIAAGDVPGYAHLHQEQADLWAHIRHGQAVEQRRLSRRPHDAYSGRLQQPDLLAALQTDLGAQRVWSASQLNDYAQCGFRFLAKRLLRLEALEEAAAGLDALQLGLLYHRILEDTFREIALYDLPIAPEAYEQARAILEEQARQVFQRPPPAFRLIPGPQWEQEQALLLRRLHALLRQDFSDESPVRAFGTSRRIWSTESPFRLPVRLTADETITVTGSIDRIDLVDGENLVAIDYKSGSTPVDNQELAAMREGRNFQMMTYLLALRALPRATGLTVAGGLFWHIRSLKTSGIIHLAQSETALQQAQSHAAEYVQRMRDGRFPVQPTRPGAGRRCSPYCDFHALCRASSTHNHTE
ncbi:MAG: PD-(D/E)XK nuclease family protein [Anaerolineae bacterium]|nr:PD-(D/E)XK nuclease family protein [Anaerolineae bacterium]